MKKFAVFSLALVVGAVPASATVTFNGVEAETLLQGGSGSPAAVTNSLVLFVASTLDGNFAPLTQGSISVGSFLHNSDDLIVAQFALSSDGVLFQAPVLTLTGNWTSGDPLAIYWIPSLGNGTSSVGAGVAYGMYTSAVAGTPPDSAAWVTPPDSGTANPMFLTTTGIFGPGGNTPNAPASAGYAGLSTAVIPEPSTFALLGGVAVLGVAVWRRRKSGVSLQPTAATGS